jgi:hypothetical protein
MRRRLSLTARTCRRPVRCQVLMPQQTCRSVPNDIYRGATCCAGFASVKHLELVNSHRPPSQPRTKRAVRIHAAEQ